MSQDNNHVLGADINISSNLANMLKSSATTLGSNLQSLNPFVVLGDDQAAIHLAEDLHNFPLKPSKSNQCNKYLSSSHRDICKFALQFRLQLLHMSEIGRGKIISIYRLLELFCEGTALRTLLSGHISLRWVILPVWKRNWRR